MISSQHLTQRCISTAFITSSRVTSTSPRCITAKGYSSGANSQSTSTTNEANKSSTTPLETAQPEKKHKKTVAELDKELQAKMSGIAGDGGESGIEYEDGQPVSMKRSVKNNMFRYI